MNSTNSKHPGRAALQFVVRGLTFILPLVFFTACQTTVRPPLPEDTTPPVRVTLSSGDVIKIVFSGAPEYNQAQKIRADGKVSLPQVGEVVATGKTLGQLQNELTALYGPLIRNTDVLVTLESAVTRVYFSGAVGRPGKITFDRPTTILQAITEAGGVNQFGNARRVQLIRLRGGVQRSQMLDLRPTLKGETTKPFYVRDGDIINVPMKAF